MGGGELAEVGVGDVQPKHTEVVRKRRASPEPAAELHKRGRERRERSRLARLGGIEHGGDAAHRNAARGEQQRPLRAEALDQRRGSEPGLAGDIGERHAARAGAGGRSQDGLEDLVIAAGARSACDLESLAPFPNGYSVI